jgi:hypothetical protein
LAAINESSPEGAEILVAAQAHPGPARPATDRYDFLADAADAGQVFAGTLFNGDGVIVPESAGETAAKSVIEDIAACMGTVALTVPVNRASTRPRPTRFSPNAPRSTPGGRPLNKMPPSHFAARRKNRGRGGGRQRGSHEGG